MMRMRFAARKFAMAPLLALLLPVFQTTLLFAQPAVQTETQAKAPIDWRAQTLNDLAHLRKLLEDHTPIPFDDENRQNKNWLADGFAAALKRAEQVNSHAGWLYTLTAYANGFGDPHVSVSQTGSLPDARWPGFIVTARGDAAVVVMTSSSMSESISVGSKIIACDGKTIPQLTAEKVFPFVMNAKLPADQRRAVTRLFLDRQNPFAVAPKICEVETNGLKKTVTLQWQNLPSETAQSTAYLDWWKRYQDASSGPAAEFGVSEPLQGVTWIGVPTFRSGPETAPKLEVLIRDVEAKAKSMRQGRAIVIDTRGNGGGNSAWADKLADAIFGSDVLKANRPPVQASAIDWRASAGNADYWKTFEKQMAREFGTFSKNRLWAQYLVGKMEDALAANVWSYRQGEDKPGVAGGQTERRPKGESPFPAKVYFLTNGSCGSSCLNFADTVLFVPGVKLIGSATSGDGMLMDVRSETLPSGQASLTFPQKVARGRGRGNLEVYLPDIAYEGAWDDKSVRAWVLEQVLGKNEKSLK